MRIPLKRQDLLHPELSYQIVGALFQTFNEIGPGMLEKAYQRRIESLLGQRGIAFASQVAIPLRFRETTVGKYIADLIVEEKVVVELKRGTRMLPSHMRQVLAYLHSLKLPLGIIAYFHNEGVSFRRVVNHSYIRSDS